MSTLLCHVPVQICHISNSKLLNKCRGQSYVYFNTNIASARNGYQSSPRSTSGNEEMPFPNKDTEHRAKKQTKPPFSQWPLDPQVLLCSITQMGRECPLGIAWWSGTLLSSKRCRLELSCLSAYNSAGRMLFKKGVKSMDMKGCIYSNNILQGESLSNVKEVQKTPTSQTSQKQGLWKCFKLYWPWAYVKKTHCKRNSNTKKVNF